ncbi:enoyl-CoA hydratase/isomerase family protein [Paeniroseomonas aquatica]|uniref:enoyl-CoA hydratase/isomerase family protein n=1 Tax=Paeniroseomonas aquatica TaxID=373043 RepID=UPI003606D441
MAPELLQETADGVLLLTMNRPEALNALGGTMMWDLLKALGEAAVDPAIGCVVLTGAGRGFSAGGDMKARATGAKPPPATPKPGPMSSAAAWNAPACCMRCPNPPSPC